MRDGFYRFYIAGDIITYQPIAAGDGLNEFSFFIDEFYAQSIEFRLHTIGNFYLIFDLMTGACPDQFGDLMTFDYFMNPFVPFSDILSIVGILQRR